MADAVLQEDLLTGLPATHSQAIASEGSLGLGWSSQQVRGMSVSAYIGCICSPSKCEHPLHADRIGAIATDTDEAYANAYNVYVDAMMLVRAHAGKPVQCACRSCLPTRWFSL